MFINVCSAWQNINLYPKGDSLYSYTKNAFIEILNYYTKSAKLNVKNLYLYDNYGEDDNRGKIIELLIKSAIMDTSINLRSKNQLINFYYIIFFFWQIYQRHFRQLIFLPKKYIQP